MHRERCKTIFRKVKDTMNKKILQLLIAILAVLSWIRVYFSQDALSVAASVIITVVLIYIVMKKR